MADLNFVRLPTNKAILSHNNETMVITAEKVSGETMKNIVFNPRDGKEVLRTTLNFNTGEGIVKYIENSFWVILLDDKPVKTISNNKNFEELSINSKNGKAVLTIKSK